jgi:hypothetical protein
MTNLKRDTTYNELQFPFDADDFDFQKSGSSSSSTLKQNLYERRNKTYAQLNQALGTNQPQLKVNISAPPVLSASTAAASKENQELQKTTATNQSPKAALVFRAPPTKSPSPVALNSSSSNQSPKVIIGFRVLPTKSPSPVLSRQTTMTSPTMVVRNQSPFLATQSIFNLSTISSTGPAVSNSEPEFQRAPTGLQVTNSHLAQRSIFAAPNIQPDTRLNTNLLNEPSSCEANSLGSFVDEIGVFPFSFKE